MLKRKINNDKYNHDLYLRIIRFIRREKEMEIIKDGYIKYYGALEGFYVNRLYILIDIGKVLRNKCCSIWDLIFKKVKVNIDMMMHLK